MWHQHIDQPKKKKDSPQEISDTVPQQTFDSQAFGTVPTELPIPPTKDTTTEAEESQQFCYPKRNLRD